MNKKIKRKKNKNKNNNLTLNTSMSNNKNISNREYILGFYNKLETAIDNCNKVISVVTSIAEDIPSDHFEKIEQLYDVVKKDIIHFQTNLKQIGKNIANFNEDDIVTGIDILNEIEMQCSSYNSVIQPNLSDLIKTVEAVV